MEISITLAIPQKIWRMLLKNVSSGEYTSQRVPFYMEFPEKLFLTK